MGANNNGQLGNNTTTQSFVPVQVQSTETGAGATGMLRNVVAVAAGAYHNLALENMGTVRSWGHNSNGQLGNADTTQRLRAESVWDATGDASQRLTNVVAIAAGYYSSYALKGDGTVWAWGHNGQGQLGDGSNSHASRPVQVKGVNGVGALSGVVAIAAGSVHALAVLSDSTVVGWGVNVSGMLGDNTSGNKNTPVEVVGENCIGKLGGVIAVAAGYYHSVALKDDGSVWAWGTNNQGQLGQGNTTLSQCPVRMMYTGNVHVSDGAGIAAAARVTYVLRGSGVWATGYGLGRGMGNGANDNDNHLLTEVTMGPSASAKLTDITAIAAGGSSGAAHGLALATTGTLYGWGAGGSGQNGNNSTASNSMAQPVLNVGYGSTTLPTCASGFCTNVLKCTIAGVTYAIGQPNPANPCQECRSTNTTAWSAKASGTNCKTDTLTCTTNACNASGSCVPTVTTGCLINNQCIPSGAAQSTGSCNVCTPSKSTTA